MDIPSDEISGLSAQSTLAAHIVIKHVISLVLL